MKRGQNGGYLHEVALSHVLHGEAGQLGGLGDAAHFLVLVLLADGQELGRLGSLGGGQDQLSQFADSFGDLLELVRRVVDQGGGPQLTDGSVVVIENL